MNDSIRITHIALMKTSLGNIKLGLYGTDAPLAVENFTKLVQMSFYDGILFHRVAKKFLIQTGDPQSRQKNKRQEWGEGGSNIWGTAGFKNELDPKTYSYKKGYTIGTIAMANRGPNTNTSQFFICLEDARYLEHEWTIFGRVLEGMEVVREISEVEIEPNSRGQDDGIPLQPVKIISINLIKK